MVLWDKGFEMRLRYDVSSMQKLVLDTDTLSQVPAKAKIKIAYLGKILDDKLTLIDQGWKEGHVVNALIVGRFNS